jgi:hypothetical protein
MRYLVPGLAAAAMLSLLVAETEATDLTFTGDVTGLCTLALSTPGTLGIDANGDLTSSVGLPSILAVLSIGSNTLTINPPVWNPFASGYTAGVEHKYVSYSGLSGLGIADQAYTESATTRTINTLPLSLLTVNAKISNSLGFVAGHYVMKVVATCAP